jgi:hypothetical protein
MQVMKILTLISDLTTAAKPRAIPDYDYDKKLLSQYDEDYPDYSGDFSKVGNEPAAAQQAPATKVQLLQDSSSKKSDGVSQRTTPTTFSSSSSSASTSDLELTKLPSTTTHRLPTSTDRTTFSTQRSTLASTFATTTARIPSTTSVAAPLSIFRDDGVARSGVNALELELLSRISGTRRDSRPIRIGSGQQGDQVRYFLLSNVGVHLQQSKVF